MDKVNKTLKRLSRRDRDRAIVVIALLESGKLTGFDIKPLRNSNSLFRVRVGEMRIIFKKIGSAVEVVDIAHRSEKTYRNI